MHQQQSEAGIGGWMRTLWQKLHPQVEADQMVRLATEQVVQIADPAIRQARHYRQVLHDPIIGAMTYFRSLIEMIPGPVVLDRNRYYDDPTVKALFASPDELDEVLRLNPEINKLRQQGCKGEVAAMMTMLRNERTMFGHKQDGEMLVRDARQQAVSFSDHRIVAPGPDLNVVKAGIVNRGLEVLGSVAMERITTPRAKKAELEGKKEYLQGMKKILGGKSHRQAMFAAPSVHNREELRKVEQLLTEVTQEIDERRQQIALPEQSLGYLEAILREPENMLHVRSLNLRLNWMGVRVDEEPGSEGNDITLAEFSMEEIQRSAVLVTFSLETKSGA